MATAARRGLARGLLAPLRPVPCPVRTTHALVRAGSNLRDAMRESMRRGDKEMYRSDTSAPAPSVEMAGQADAMRNKYLLPGTFVRLPLSKWPFQPASLFKYLYATLHSITQNTLMTWGYRIGSMPKGSFRAAFRPQKRQIVPTAVVLHRRFNEAFADGDLRTLREICHEPLFDVLSNVVAARKRSEAMTWELVESHSRLLLPRLIFHRAAPVPDSRYAQQSAVVRFDTTQKLTKWHAWGEPVKGGVRAQRKRENMVLMRSVDSKGYKPEPWKVWGFEEEMTLKAWEDMERGKKALEKDGLEKRARELGTNLPKGR